MPQLNDREYQSILKAIEDNHKTVMDLLALRKDYWDERIDKICNSLTEMKDHCRRQQDNCAIVFKDFDKRLDESHDDITKIKTVGSILALVWGAFVTAATHFMRKL